MTPVGPQLAKAYANEREKFDARHSAKWEQMELPFNKPLNKNKDQQFPPHKNPFDYGNSESKADVKDKLKKWNQEHDKLKKKPKEDLEAILNLEEELWNS